MSAPAAAASTATATAPTVPTAASSAKKPNTTEKGSNNKKKERSHHRHVAPFSYDVREDVAFTDAERRRFLSNKINKYSHRIKGLNAKRRALKRSLYNMDPDAAKNVHTASPPPPPSPYQPPESRPAPPLAARDPKFQAFVQFIRGIPPGGVCKLPAGLLPSGFGESSDSDSSSSSAAM